VHGTHCDKAALLPVTPSHREEQTPPITHTFADRYLLDLLLLSASNTGAPDLAENPLGFLLPLLGRRRLDVGGLRLEKLAHELALRHLGRQRQQHLP